MRERKWLEVEVILSNLVNISWKKRNNCVEGKDRIAKIETEYCKSTNYKENLTNKNKNNIKLK